MDENPHKAPGRRADGASEANSQVRQSKGIRTYDFDNDEFRSVANKETVSLYIALYVTSQAVAMLNCIFVRNFSL